jgi:hypothetical protein
MLLLPKVLRLKASKREAKLEQRCRRAEEHQEQKAAGGVD